MTTEEFENKSKEESSKTLEVFVSSLGVDEEIEQILVENGFSSQEEIAYVPKEELLAIDAFDEDIVNELRNRANDILLTQALSSGGGVPDETLLGMDGMTNDLANKLVGTKVVPGDLNESIYDNLFILKRKGDKYIFTNGKYGKPSQ